MDALAKSNAQLLADLLGIAEERAASLLRDGLRGLAGDGGAALVRERALGPRAAARIAAALELGARIASEGAEPRPVLRTPEEAARWLLPRYAARPVETFGLLTLNVRRRLIRERVISVGCLTSSLVHPREVFAAAIQDRAAAVILFHNHPSGDPEPSVEDVSLTRRLAAAGTLLGIEALDHVVVGAGRCVSMKERGTL